MARLLFDAPVFLLPVLLPFVPAVKWKNRKSRSAFLWSTSIVCALLLILHWQPAFWLEPSMRDYVTAHGVMDGSTINGPRPVILGNGIRLVLTALVIAGIGSVAAAIREAQPRSEQIGAARQDALSWASLFALISPFLAVYLALLISRAGIFMVVDRYLLALLFFLLLLLARWYQDRIYHQLPRYSFGLLAIVAIYAMGTTHDAFAMLRTRLQAVQELESRGVPAIEIDGGLEPNMWTVLRAGGTLIPFEGDSSAPRSHRDPELVCEPELASSMPGLHPRYALSFDPDACGGPVGFPAVPYHEWFGPSEVNIYVVSSRRQQPSTLVGGQD
jgi:hypothetical protein